VGRLLIEESLDTGDHASAFYANDVGPLVGARQIMRRRVYWVQRRCSFPLQLDLVDGRREAVAYVVGRQVVDHAGHA
jgi:hypothetical protein